MFGIMQDSSHFYPGCDEAISEDDRWASRSFYGVMVNTGGSKPSTRSSILRGSHLFDQLTSS